MQPPPPPIKKEPKLKFKKKTHNNNKNGNCQYQDNSYSIISKFMQNRFLMLSCLQPMNEEVLYIIFNSSYTYNLLSLNGIRVKH